MYFWYVFRVGTHTSHGTRMIKNFPFDLLAFHTKTSYQNRFPKLKLAVSPSVLRMNSANNIILMHKIKCRYLFSISRCFSVDIITLLGTKFARIFDLMLVWNRINNCNRHSNIHLLVPFFRNEYRNRTSDYNMSNRDIELKIFLIWFSNKVANVVASSAAPVRIVV